MITEAVVDRMLTLAEIAPFNVLKESELLLVAQHTHSRDYSADELILASGHVAEVVIVAVSGTTYCGRGSNLEVQSAIIGAPSVLFSMPIKHDVFAGAGGVGTLCLAKPHLFTIARECPDFVVGLAQIYSGAAK